MVPLNACIGNVAGNCLNTELVKGELQSSHNLSFPSQEGLLNVEMPKNYFTFCLPGNLNLALLKASMAAALLPSFVLKDMMTWPMLTRATVP